MRWRLGIFILINILIKVTALNNNMRGNDLTDSQRKIFSRAKVGQKLRRERLAKAEQIMSNGFAKMKLSNSVELVGSEIYSPHTSKSPCDSEIVDKVKKNKPVIVSKMPFVPTERKQKYAPVQPIESSSELIEPQRPHLHEDTEISVSEIIRS